MFRPASHADQPAIEAFLARHAESSMFLRSNLRAHGMGERRAPHGMRIWVTGEVDGVFALTNGGYLLCQAPMATSAHWCAFADALEGCVVNGMTGDATQIAQLKQALGMERAAWALDDPEPLYTLPLDQLVLPPGAGQLRTPEEADRALLYDWMRAYAEEMRITSPARLDQEAEERVARALANGDMRLLDQQGQPVAMAAINARLPDMVQVGGVFTPPKARRQGLARRVVGLMLAEERVRGVDTAILFASGPAASRAYETLGFRCIGRYAVCVLKDPVTLPMPKEAP